MMQVETDSKEATLHLAHSSRMKTLLFQVCLRHQVSIEKVKVKPDFKTWLQLLFIPVQMIQVLSLVCQTLTSLQTTNSEYSYIQDVLEVSRPDLWAVQSGNQVVAVLCTLVALLGIFIVSAVDAGLVYNHKEFWILDYLRGAAGFLVYCFQRYLFLPLTILGAYQSAGCGNDTKDKCAASGLGYLSIAEALGCALLVIARVCFVFESAWSQRSVHLLSRPNPLFELKELGCLLIIGVLSQVSESPALVLVLYLILSIYLLLQLYVQLPYYHSLTMHLKCAEYCLCAWASGCGLVGLGIDSMTVVIVLFAFVSPCLCMVNAHLLNWLITHTKFTKNHQTFQRYETTIRLEFAGYEAGSIPQEALSDCLDYGARLFSDSKDYYLLLSQYYFYIRNEPELALLRLSAASTCADALLTDFQVFRLSEMLTKLTKSEERDFVDYQDMYRYAKTLDRGLCETTYDLFNTIIHHQTTSHQLEQSFLHLAQRLKHTKLTYVQLKDNFPAEPFALETFGTFLVNVLHDPAAHELVSRGIVERNRRKRANINYIEAYSSEDTGVLIISCHHQNFGKIIYANDQMASTLNCTIQEIVGKDLDDFIPPPYNHNHNNQLSRFLAKGEAKQVFRSNLFLSANQKYTVEVTFRFRPTSVKNVPYFVVAVRAKPKSREFVLFDEDGVITSHSQFFPIAVGRQERQSRLNGTLLEEWLPGVLQHHVNEKIPLVYVHPVTNSTFGLMFSKTSFGSSTVHWVYLFARERGIEDLFNTSNSHVIEDFHTKIKTPRKVVSPIEPLPEVNKVRISSFHVPTDQPTQITQNPQVKDSQEGTPTVPLSSYAYSTPGNKLRHQILFAVKASKISYLLNLLVIGVIVSTTLLVLYTTLKSTQSSSIADMGASRLHMVRITHYARRLQLIETGLEAKELERGLMVQMQSEIARLSAVVNTYFESQRGDVSVWNLISEQFIYRRVPLFTALTDFITFANVYAAAPRGEIDPSLYYIYTNGLGDLFRVLNTTVIEESFTQQSDSFSLVRLTSRVTLLFLSLTLAISTQFIIRSLYLLERYYRRLWQVIVNLKVFNMRMIMMAHKDRIEVTHSVDYVPAEQTKVKSNPGMMNPPRRWGLLLTEVMLFALAFCAFILFVMLYGSQELTVLLALNGNYLNVVSESSLMPTLLLHLLQEDYLNSNSSQRYQGIVKEGQSFYSFREQLLQESKVLMDFETQILENLQSLPASPDQEEALFNACPSFNASQACVGTALAKGQHQAIVDFRFLIQDLSKRLSEGSLDWQELVHLEEYVDSLVKATVLKMYNMQNYVTQTTADFTHMMVLGSCLYALVAMLLFVLVYMPMINAAKKRCMSLWRITTMIRTDFVPST